jgi:regulator of replication initiation timing
MADKKEKKDKFVTKEKFKNRTRKLKIEIDDLKIQLDEIRNLIKYEVDSAINKHINEMITTQINDAIKDIYRRADRKIIKGYLDECETVARLFIESAINKGISWQMKTVKMDKASKNSRIQDLYDDGWHITFAGKLKEGGENVIMFEKPNKVKTESDQKNISKESKRDVKKKAKVNRSPA